jgi:hypothetical protein
MRKFLTVIGPRRAGKGTPKLGGVAAHQENVAKPPKLAQTGWFPQEPPRRSLEKRANGTPPNLEGSVQS